MATANHSGGCLAHLRAGAYRLGAHALIGSRTTHSCGMAALLQPHPVRKTQCEAAAHRVCCQLFVGVNPSRNASKLRICDERLLDDGAKFCGVCLIASSENRANDFFYRHFLSGKHASDNAGKAWLIPLRFVTNGPLQRSNPSLRFYLRVYSRQFFNQLLPSAR